MENSYSSGSSDSEYFSALYAIWSVQDSLLQYYRTMFITAQSLLIAVSASIADSKNQAFTISLVLVGAVLWYVWISTTGQRARNVNFIQKLLEAGELGKRVSGPFTSFREYQNKWFHEGSYVIRYLDQSSEPFVYPGVWPPKDVSWWKFSRWGTRIHMEVSLPGVYLLGWIIIGIYAFAR